MGYKVFYSYQSDIDTKLNNFFIERAIKKAVKEIEEADVGTHKELESITRHLVSKEYAKAIREPAKIVEVKLKEKIANDDTYNKRPVLQFLLEHAKNCKWISNQDFENTLHIKEIRNKESHELSVNSSPLEAGLAVFAGIKVLYAVARRR
jgi:hypothetical protein